MTKKIRLCLYKDNDEIININDVFEIFFLPFAVHISSEYSVFDFDYSDFNRIEVTYYD